MSEDVEKQLETPLSDQSAFWLPQVHQYTLHGYTYPFVEAYGEARLPEPVPNHKEFSSSSASSASAPSAGRDRSRRHSMLAGLLLAKPGDLVVFFQSDPQDPDLGTLRGLRGVFRVAAHDNNLPYAARRAHHSSLRHPDHNDYRLHAACPACSSVYADLGSTCPMCGKPYPSSRFKRGKEKLPEHVLSLSVPLEPLYVFKKEVSDERFYADLSVPIIPWVGRHDNQMGRGKGSSIRQLLPEEYHRLVKMLLTEPGQAPSKVHPKCPPSGGPLKNPDGTNLEQFVFFNEIVLEELALNTAFSLQLHNSQSSLWQALWSSVPFKRSEVYLEYASSEFPWGYTGGTSDFVLVFRDRDRSTCRRHVVLFEFKRDAINVEAVIQVWLYVPWVAQVFALNLKEDNPFLVGCSGSPEIHVYPIVVGSRPVRNFSGLPDTYDRSISYVTGVKVKHKVYRPVLWCYEPKAPTKGLYRSEVEFHLCSGTRSTINFVKNVGVSTTEQQIKQVSREFKALLKLLKRPAS